MHFGRKFAGILVLGILSLGFSGCIPVPKFLKPGKPGQRLAWRETRFPVPLDGPAEIRIRNGANQAGIIKLLPAPGHGTETGSLVYQARSGRIHRIPAFWQGTLVDAAEICWSSGERWGLFAWDTGTNPWYRTITIYDPGPPAFYSCELMFSQAAGIPSPTPITYRFTWEPGKADLAKYRRFLDSVKGGYATDPTRGSETRGTLIFRKGLQASAAFLLDRGLPLQDRFMRTEGPTPD